MWWMLMSQQEVGQLKNMFNDRKPKKANNVVD